MPRAAPASPSRGAALGLAAAALFGASTPLAKLLAPGASAIMLAGLLYVGAGLGLVGYGLIRRHPGEAPLRRADLPALAAMILAGGVIGPVLLVLGLSRLSGVAASLLLNLEAPLTMALAALALRERLSGREATGAAAVVAGAALLGWSPGRVEADPLGVLLVACACAAWAADNTLSQRLSIRDPVAVARAKVLPAGLFNVLLALLTGAQLPSAGHAAAALATGALGYGASMVLFLLAVRAMGAARQAAYFATAPFLGAALAVPLLGERLLPLQLGAGALMALGVALITGAHHGHTHVHEPVEHEHAHVHDEHHAHGHDDPMTEPHSHAHRHEPLAHDHPHLPDLHHRHGH
ncbi:MAG: EamA family transporter [Anaeromyxobacter sp.]